MTPPCARPPVWAARRRGTTLAAVPNVGDEVGQGAQRLRFLTIEPELLELESSWDGGTGMPPMHLHPSQTERFTVLDGALKTVIAGQERRYAAGESFEIPPGTPHQMTSDGPARANWQISPALRSPEFFERLFTGQAGEGFFHEFRAEFRVA